MSGSNAGEPAAKKLKVIDPTDAAADAADATRASGASVDQQDADALHKAEQTLKQAQMSANARRDALLQTKAHLAGLRQSLAEAQARLISMKHGTTPERKYTPSRNAIIDSDDSSESDDDQEGGGNKANGSAGCMNSPSGAGGAGGAGHAGGPCFDLPVELQEYTGDKNDRKALMAWKKARAEAEAKLQRKKWVQLHGQPVAAAGLPLIYTLFVIVCVG